MCNRKANLGSRVPFTEGEYWWTIVPVRGSIGGPSCGDEQGRLRACLGPGSREERWALITQSTMVRALPRVVWQKDQVVDSRHRGPRATARVPIC